jgi:hypothetical protein
MKTSSPHSKDRIEMRPGVFERKWELDSLCYCIRVAYQYWKVTGTTAAFDQEWKDAMHLVVATMRDQQREKSQGLYHFFPEGRKEPYGPPMKPTGMICTMFRNSDDASTYLFNIPDNLFAVTSLHQLAEMADALMPGDGLAADCRALAAEVQKGIDEYGTVTDAKWGKHYLYECDGMGHTLLMDDAGLPNLLSIPYFSPSLAGNPVVLASRRWSLSPEDPWYITGTAGEGLGSVHKGKGNIWPLGLIARAITSTDDAEITSNLIMLKRSSVGTGFIHESFKKDDPSKFSRKWFAWANNLFGEMIIKVANERPELLGKQLPD